MKMEPAIGYLRNGPQIAQMHANGRLLTNNAAVNGKTHPCHLWLASILQIRVICGSSPSFKSAARPPIDYVLWVRMSQYWLVKQEPTTYSWEQFVSDGKTEWTGVRNFQARNNLRAMKVGDQVFYYHSVNGKAIVGIAKVTREAFRDPTATDGDWSAVELVPLQQIKPPVTLAQIKNESRLANIALLKNSRLSVIPVSRLEFETIQEIVNKDHP